VVPPARASSVSDNLGKAGDALGVAPTSPFRPSGLTSGMPRVLPETDVASIREPCEARVPSDAREQIRVELEHERQAVNIGERRPPWRDDYGPEWSLLPVARLRYVASTRLRTLYLPPPRGPTGALPAARAVSPLEDLLSEIAEDPICVFRG